MPNVDEIQAIVTERVKRGSAVVLFNNIDDYVAFVDFFRIVSFAYGVEPPLDLSCVVVKS